MRFVCQEDFSKMRATDCGCYCGRHTEAESTEKKTGSFTETGRILYVYGAISVRSPGLANHKTDPVSA